MASLDVFSALLFSFLSCSFWLFFFTVCICCCLFAFNKRLHTPSITTKTDTPSSSSSSDISSSPPPSGKFKYDVFLSFRGEDTRKNFTDHLYSALKDKGIVTFRDDEELERGESIAPNLLKAIEQSRYAVVVFSRNYANSSWCLDEIAKMVECMKDMRQKILPVFYGVDPSDVRDQKGDHFGKAFSKHKKWFESNPDNKVQTWKNALSQVANLAGWHVKYGYESEAIRNIVQKIFTGLKQKTSTSMEDYVGMDSHPNKMPYIDIGGPDDRILGSRWMDGIRKTTIAQIDSEMVQYQFEDYRVLENVTGMRYWDMNSEYESQSPQRHRQNHCVPPPVELYKLHVAGHVDGDGLYGGVGGVVRNYEGLLMGAVAKEVIGNISVLETELLAIKRGLEFALECNLFPLIVESDFEEAVDQVNNKVYDEGTLVLEIQKLLVRLNITKVYCCLPKCNKVACSIARFIVRRGGRFKCFEDGPPWLMEDIDRDRSVFYKYWGSAL